MALEAALVKEGKVLERPHFIHLVHSSSTPEARVLVGTGRVHSGRIVQRSHFTTTANNNTSR